MSDQQAGEQGPEAVADHDATAGPDTAPAPLPPDADGAFAPPLMPAPPPVPAPMLAPPPLVPDDMPPPLPPPPLVCATPTATLKAKAATAAVLSNPYRMGETSRLRRTLASEAGQTRNGVESFGASTKIL